VFLLSWIGRIRSRAGENFPEARRKTNESLFGFEYYLSQRAKTAMGYPRVFSLSNFFYPRKLPQDPTNKIHLPNKNTHFIF
jgi:hypothetical protein